MLKARSGIVVGVDGSAHADSALLWAWLEARRQGVALTAVTAGVPDDASAPDQQLVTKAITRLQEQLPQDVGVGEIQAAFVAGPVVPALLEFAREATMLVVGRRGLGRLGRMFMGSVSAGLAREAEVPVTIVPSGWVPAPASATDGDAGAGEATRIVVGVDGSVASQAALEHGITVAQRTGGVLEAVSCWQILSVGALPHGHGWAPPIEDYQEHVTAMLDDALRAAQSRTGGLGPDAVRAVVEHALPARGLLKHAQGAQRLIVGHRGLGGFDRLLLGSVSSQLIEHAPCPVTVIRTR